jgi:hypothetical protein
MKTIAKIALIAGIAGAAAYGVEPQEKLTVYLRFTPIDRHTIRFMAQDMAARMFAQIGVSLEWKPWQPATESLRLPIVIDIVSETPDDLLPNALGYARPYEGGRITIFLDRVERTNYPAYVLAHVMVHEITHVLQGVSRHSDSGVMKARWSIGDFCEMRQRAVPFASEDVRLIHDGLAARRALLMEEVQR